MASRKRKTTRVYRKGYEAYKVKYKEAERKLMEKGYAGMQDAMYSKEMFELMFKAKYNTLKEQGQKTPNVIRSLINDQKYRWSEKQSRTLYKALKESGETVTLMDVRTNKVKLDAIMSKKYREYKDYYLDQGFTAHEAVKMAGKQIHQEYIYGS